MSMTVFLTEFKNYIDQINDNACDINTIERSKSEITNAVFTGKTLTPNYVYFNEDVFLLCEKHDVTPRHIISVFDYLTLLNLLSSTIELKNIELYASAEKLAQKYYKLYGEDLLKVIGKE